MSPDDAYLEILDQFCDEEINIVCKHADLELFLSPIKDKRYTKYVKTWGRLDKKTVLVKKLLPGIAFTLYMKGEKPFLKAVAVQLKRYKSMFEETIFECDDSVVSKDKIEKYSIEKMADLYFELSDKLKWDIPVDVFFIMLKLQEIVIEEKRRQSITMHINLIRMENDLEKKHKLEINEALKAQSKKLHEEYEHEKSELKKQYEELCAKYRKSQEKTEAMELRVNELENMTENEKQQQEMKWFSEYEKKLLLRKKEDDEQRQHEIDEAEIRFQELILSQEREAGLKKKELEILYQNQVNAAEESFKKVLDCLKSKVDVLKKEKQNLEELIITLTNKQGEIETVITELERKEQNYFDSFEQRVLNREIDTILFNKLSKKRGEITEQPGASIALLSQDEKTFVVSEAKSFSTDTEYGTDVGNLEDFFEDFKCNISMNFEDETDISATILSAFINQFSVVVSDGACDFVAQAFSALLDMGKPLVLSSCSSETNLTAIVNTIKNSLSQVVCIKGILDNYDENLFRRLCELCRGKYLFFSIANIEGINMMSKSIMNYAVIIEIESKLHFTTDEVILIGDHDFETLRPELSRKRNRELYKKHFSRLVTNSLIKQSVALNYSCLLQEYYELSCGEKLGEIIQRVILNACEYEKNDEDATDIISKSGITLLDV